MNLLVTGGAGFIGSNFIRFVLQNQSDWTVTNLDKLTYAGNLENLKDCERNSHYSFIKGDIADRELVNNLLSNDFDAIINFAAESHVDRSIMDASPFIETNIKGTQILLEGARQHGIKRFIQISTDEVYGSLGSEGKFTEESLLSPNNPYAASKTAADLLCRAYYRTYGLPVIITRSSNNFGPYQFPEKLIPVLILNASQDKPLPIYGQGKNIRDWIYVLDNCEAIDLVLQKGKVGEIYNIGAGNEKANIEIANLVLEQLEKPKILIEFVPDRLGHDLRYSLDTAKIAKLGWKPHLNFDECLIETIKWYKKNEWWWRPLLNGEESRKEARQ
jgi:dTDP-glucose 4,6-dehydratase